MRFSACAQRAINGWVAISTILLLQNTNCFSDASPLPDASHNLRRQDEYKPHPQEDEYISKHGGNEEYERRPVSNYDYYKPLNSPEKSRNTYLEEKKRLTSKDDERNWLKNDDYESESDEVEEKPVYGYKLEEQRDSKDKEMDEDTLFKDNKKGFFSDWKYDKHNGWKSKDKHVPLKLQSERHFPLKLNLDTSKEKDSSYKSIDAYPIKDKHSNKGTWNTHDQSILKDDNRSFKSERGQFPKQTNGPLVVRPNNERSASYSKSYEDEKEDWNKQKADLEKEAEKEIRKEKFNARNKWLGDNDQYRNEPESKHSAYAGKDDFFKDIQKPQLLPKSFPVITSKLNHGGHSYGMTYTPSKELRHLIDGNRKATFLEEHEKKLEEMHKKHMKSFEKFMNKPFQGSKRGYSNAKNQESDELYEKPDYDTKTRVYIVNPKNQEAEREVDHHVSINKYEPTDKTQLNNPPSKTSFPYHLWN